MNLESRGANDFRVSGKRCRERIYASGIGEPSITRHDARFSSRARFKGDYSRSTGRLFSLGRLSVQTWLRLPCVSPSLCSLISFKGPVSQTERVIISFPTIIIPVVGFAWTCRFGGDESATMRFLDENEGTVNLFVRKYSSIATLSLQIYIYIYRSGYFYVQLLFKCCCYSRRLLLGNTQRENLENFAKIAKKATVITSCQEMQLLYYSKRELSTICYRKVRVSRYPSYVEDKDVTFKRNEQII